MAADIDFDARPARRSLADLRLRPTTSALGRHEHTDPTPSRQRRCPALLAGARRHRSGPHRLRQDPRLRHPADRARRSAPRGVQALVLIPTRELATRSAASSTQLGRRRAASSADLRRPRARPADRDALAAARRSSSARRAACSTCSTRARSGLDGVRFLVLDEADEMLDRGFAPDVERILARTPARAADGALLGDRAGMGARDRAQVPARPGDGRGRPRAGGQRAEIEHIVYESPTGTSWTCCVTCSTSRGDGSIIVFGRTKHGVKKLARAAGARWAIRSRALQGNLSQNARDRVMEDFRSGAMPILLATNVAARGLGRHRRRGR